jgi:acetyl esterase/lipase
VRHRLPPAPAVAYGDHPDQVANLHLPAADGPFAAVALIHGGFWRAGWDRTTLTPLARELASRGFAAWNVEYRRVGQAGGGWPGTFADVAAAIDHLAGLAAVDDARVVTLGHSAGGHLALWVAGRAQAAAAPGGPPRVQPRGVVGLAAVSDLISGHEAGLGNGAVADLLGGTPADVPERYASSSPAALCPLGVPQLLVHGGLDESVPVAQSRTYAGRARAHGDDVELVELPDADHFDVIDPGHAAWRVVTDRLPALAR